MADPRPGDYLIKWIRNDETFYESESVAFRKIEEQSASGILSKWLLVKVVAVCTPSVSLKIERER